MLFTSRGIGASASIGFGAAIFAAGACTPFLFRTSDGLTLSGFPAIGTNEFCTICDLGCSGVGLSVLFSNSEARSSGRGGISISSTGGSGLSDSVLSKLTHVVLSRGINPLASYSSVPQESSLVALISQNFVPIGIGKYKGPCFANLAFFARADFFSHSGHFHAGRFRIALIVSSDKLRQAGWYHCGQWSHPIRSLDVGFRQ